ncbi:MAG: histidine kinase [Halodesulfurarchaeum sp.]
MATETGRHVRTEFQVLDWKAGALGGIAGAIVMGALMLVMNEAVITVAIPSLYLLVPPPSVLQGMGVHVFHGAALGIVFAGVIQALGVESTSKVVGLAILWGVVIWVTLAALLMPVWLGVVGSPASPPFPNFAPPSLLWHVVYGLVLGGVYVAVEKSL